MTTRASLSTYLTITVLILSIPIAAVAKTIHVAGDATGANDGTTWEDAYFYLQDALMFAAGGKTIYVDADAGGANDGTSWADAYNYLQHALTSPEPVEIRVAQGTYRPGHARTATFQLGNGLIIKGGYAGCGAPDPNARDTELYETILSGDLNGDDSNGGDNSENSYHVVRVGPVDPNTIIDGFTITGGNASGQWWDERNEGGGMCNMEGNPTIINCIFKGNSATNDGGGIYNRLGNPTLINCTFVGNSAGYDGGGMSNSGTVYDYITPVLINCRFSGNSGKYGGAINNRCSNASLTNCTFAGNSASELCGGMRNWYSSTTVTNCILWANQDRNGVRRSAQFEQVHDGSGAISVINYCCVQGQTGGLGGTGNIGAEPLFIDSDGLDNVLGTQDDNLRLLGGSPCLDMGDTSVVEATTDLDGNPRIINGAVDMGAYEGANQGFVLSTQSVIIIEGQTATFTVTLAMDPQGEVEATVINQSGDSDIIISFGNTLAFDSSDYSVPQLVTLEAVDDEDYFHGEALICVSAESLATVEVGATELDNDVPSVLYVDDDALGANDGTTWADAFRNLQDAMSVAPMLPEVKEIHVAQGTYCPDRGVNRVRGDRAATFCLINGVALRGSYAGSGESWANDRDFNLYESILSGDLDRNDVHMSNPCGLLNDPSRSENSYHVVTGSQADATAVLDGFTVSDGNANNASSESPDRQDRGGGMYNSCFDPDGYWQESDATVINCKFVGNSAIEDGGGMYSCNGSPKIAYCTFIGNCARFGGGMCGSDSLATLSNCIFSGNSAVMNGGGIMFGCDDCPTLFNCTISGNSAGNSGGGMWNCDSYGLLMFNCILWGNTDNSRMSETAQIGGMYSQDINHCCIQGWAGDGIANIDLDPCFADPGYWDANGTPEDTSDEYWVDGDYHLKSQAGRWDPNTQTWVIDDATSPCIDAGDPMSHIGPEPFGNGGMVNMGVYGGTTEASKSYFGGLPCEIIMAGDINGDCEINFLDFLLMALHWCEDHNL